MNTVELERDLQKARKEVVAASHDNTLEPPYLTLATEGFVPEDIIIATKRVSGYQRLITIIRYYDYEPMLILAGIVSAGWGIWLGLPFAVAFVAASSVAPDWMWGTAMVMGGIGQLLGVTFGRNDVVKHSTFMACFVWTLALVISFLGPNTIPVFLANASLLIINLWIYFRVPYYRRSGENQWIGLRQRLHQQQKVDH